MKIHKVLVQGSNQTVCGVSRPRNTTVDAPLVTCKKCKHINKYLLGKVSDVAGLKEALRGLDDLEFVFPVKVWLAPAYNKPDVIILENT